MVHSERCFGIPMTMSRNPISKYCVRLVPFLVVAGLCLLLNHEPGDEHGLRAQEVPAAERKEELGDVSQSLPTLGAREPLGGALTDAGWIELADEESLAPLEPERLWMQLLDEGRNEPFPVEAREPLSPERMAPSRVLARVPGYVPFSGRLTPRAGANVLLLKRAGGLEVKILDTAGRPVEDCVVRLFLDQGGNENLLAERNSIFIFPDEFTGTSAKTVHELIHTPRGWVQSQEAAGKSDWLKTFEQGDWDSSVRRTSADGRATWTDIPALEGYRWYVEPLPYVEVEPPHERSRLEEVGDHVRTSIPPPPGLSGRFEITAGATLRLAGTLLAAARVHGRIDCPSAKGAAVVSLYSVDRAGGNTGPEVVSFDEARSQRSGPEGAFEFVDARPGIWAVRAWWEEERNYFFTCATFRLEAGADLDLGMLHPLAGESLEIAIGIADQNGVPQAPEVVYSATSDQLNAHLSITAVPDSGLATQIVYGYFPLAFGEIFRIHGLQPGRVYLSADPSPGLTLDPARVGGIVGVHPEGFAVGSTDFVFLELTARMGTARPLLLRNEQGDDVLAPAIWVRDLGSDRVSSVRPHRLDPTGAERGQALNLHSGSYELLCKFRTGDSPQGVSARASVIFDDTDRGPIELDVRPAVSVSGVLRDSSGAGIPDENLVWALKGWALDPDNPVFAATTDSQGAFVLGEIPAHAALRCSRAGCDLPPLAPGKHEGLVLTTTP